MSKTGWTYTPINVKAFDPFPSDDEYAYIEEEDQMVNLNDYTEPWRWVEMHEEALESLKLKRDKRDDK